MAITISGGQSSSGVVVGSGGTDTTVYVESGGFAVDTMLNSGGYAYIYSGGTTDYTQVNSGGYELISGGGFAQYTDLNSAGTETIAYLGIAQGTINSGGIDSVEYGGEAINAIILAGGIEAISSGGFTVSTTVSSGGLETVSAYGVASGAIVSSGGIQEVFVSAIASGTVIDNGGEVIVGSGGLVTGVVFHPGGEIDLQGLSYSAGGQATLDSITDVLSVTEGSVTATVQLSGMYTSLTLSLGSDGQGGTVVSASVPAPVLVASGDVYSAGTLSYAAGRLTLEVSSGGEAVSSFIGSGGIATISSAGVAISSFVGSAGTLVVSPGGSAEESVISSLGEELVSNGLAANTILAGGYMLVHGGLASATAIDSGSNAVSGGTQEVQSGGFASATIVEHGGAQFVNSGGLARFSVFASGGSEIVSAGGDAISSYVGTSASLLVFDGGQVSGVQVVAGGIAIVSSGGVIDSGFVLSGGVESVDGGSAEKTDVFAGGEQEVTGLATGAVLEGGQQFVSAGGVASGTVIYAGGEAFILSGGAGIAATLFYGAQELVSAGGAATDTNLMGGGTLTLAGLGYAAGATASLAGSTDVLTISTGGVSYGTQLTGFYGTDVFYVTSASDGGISVSIDPACFAQGTRIVTARGKLAVEDITPEDWLPTLVGNRLRRVRWVGVRHTPVARHPAPHTVRPVRIRRGAFGATVPDTDLVLSPQHAIMVCDQNGQKLLVPVRHLVNGVSIVQEEVESIVYYHIELSDDAGGAVHDVMVAHGLGVESYLDTGNRGAFENNGAAVMLHPDFENQGANALTCLPLAQDPERLAAVRAVLAYQLSQNGHVLTADPDLRVNADGQWIAPRMEKGEYQFVIPPGTRKQCLVSRGFVPAQHYTDSYDERWLGVAVSRMIVDGNAVDLADARLRAGWHAPQETWRWTNGDAELPAGGVISVQLEPCQRGMYWRRADKVARARKMRGRGK